MTIEFSIIIVNWNTAALLHNCLESIKQHIQTVSYEIVVVDNASNDDCGAMIQTHFPSVRLIANQENLGYARANNQGIRQSQGHYIVLLNPDTVLLNNILAKFLHLFEQKPEIGIIGPKLITPDGSNQRWARGKMLSLGTAVNHYLFLSALLPRQFSGVVDNRDYPSPTPMEWVSGACLAVRRAALDKVGLLDESIFMYSEDMELCHRVRQAGYQVMYVPQAQVQHFIGQSLQQQTDQTVLAAPLVNQDMFFQQLYDHQGVLAFRTVVWLGSLLRWAGQWLFTTGPKDYKRIEARRNASTAWRLWLKTWQKKQC